MHTLRSVVPDFLVASGFLTMLRCSEATPEHLNIVQKPLARSMVLVGREFSVYNAERSGNKCALYLLLCRSKI